MRKELTKNIFIIIVITFVSIAIEMNFKARALAWIIIFFLALEFEVDGFKRDVCLHVT